MKTLLINLYGTICLFSFLLAQYPISTIKEIQQVTADSLLLADSVGISSLHWLTQASMKRDSMVEVTALVTVPSGVITFTAGGRTLMVTDTGTNAGKEWSGILVRYAGSQASFSSNGYESIQRGDIIRMRGRILEFPVSSTVSMTQFDPDTTYPISLLSSSNVLPIPQLKNISDFYSGFYPGGKIKFSSGEPWEGSQVVLTNVTVFSTVNVARGTWQVIDNAGNTMSMYDWSRYFTLGHGGTEIVAGDTSYKVPAIGTKIDTLRGYIATASGADANRGYRICPIFPGDIRYTPAPPKINVTFNVNTSTFPDTLQTSSFVQLRGGLPEFGGWSLYSPVILNNVGGDYWNKTVLLPVDTSFDYKIFANVNSIIDAANEHVGWEGDFLESNRKITLGRNDTTIKLQFINGTMTLLPQYWRPYGLNDTNDSIDVLFRINLASHNSFSKSTMKVGVRGGTSPLDWSKTYFLTQDPAHYNGSTPYDHTNFYSGSLRFPKSSIGDTVIYKFVIHNNNNLIDPLEWENITQIAPDMQYGNRAFPRKANWSGDTTLYWKYWNNKSPDVVKTLTIAQARQDLNGDLIPDYSISKETIRINGVITSPNFASTGYQIYIQDETAGINFFTTSNNFPMIMGDSVQIIGTIIQFRGLTEITPLVFDTIHIRVFKHNTVLPIPKKLSLHEFVVNAEHYEGQLIEIDSLIKTTGTWPVLGINAILGFTNPNYIDSTIVFIDSQTNIDGTPEPQYPIKVIGIAGQYSSSSSIYNNGYQIIPRDSGDIRSISYNHARNIPLKTSWNLVSWNVDTPVDSTLSVLSAVKAKVKVGLGYNSGGLTYDPTIPFQFNTLTQMDHLHGYWLKMLDTATLYVQGTAVNGQTPLNLTTGYNLVSYLPLNADSLTHALTSVLPQTTVVLGYDNGGLTYDPTIPSQFNTLQIMRPGFGYWIKSKVNTTLTYPATSVYSGAGAVPEGMLSQQNAEVTPTQGWVSLWAQQLMLGGRLIPAGTKVRVTSQSKVLCGEGEFWSDGKFGLLPIYLDDQTTEEIEGLKESEGYTVTIGDYTIPKVIRWKEMGEVVNLKDAATGILELGTLPTEYALDQNYPNPFNPSTTIRYQLPEAGKVSLKVYNTLGMEVETLDESHKDAGFYSINWNAGRLASGVYFCRMQSGNYKKTMKMQLMK